MRTGGAEGEGVTLPESKWRETVNGWGAGGGGIFDIIKRMKKQQKQCRKECPHLTSLLITWLLWRPDMNSLALRSLRDRE